MKKLQYKKDLNELATEIFNEEIVHYETIFKDKILKKEFMKFITPKIDKSHYKGKRPESPEEIRKFDINLMGLNHISKVNPSLGIEASIKKSTFLRNNFIKESFQYVKYLMTKNGTISAFNNMRKADFDDSFQLHLEGVSKSLSGFNPKMGKFTTYAFYGSLKCRNDWYRNKDFVHVPATKLNDKELMKTLYSSYIEDHVSKLNVENRQSTNSDLFFDKEVDKSFIDSSLNRFSKNSFLLDYSFDQVDALIKKSRVTEKEFAVYFLRVFGFTLTDVGIMFSLSRERIRQISNSFSEKLQKNEGGKQILEVFNELIKGYSLQAQTDKGKNDNMKCLVKTYKELQKLFCKKEFGQRTVLKFNFFQPPTPQK